MSDFVQQVDRYADDTDCNGCALIKKIQTKNKSDKSVLIRLICVSTPYQFIWIFNIINYQLKNYLSPSLLLDF